MKKSQICDGANVRVYAQAEYLDKNGDVIGDALIMAQYDAQEDGTPDISGEKAIFIITNAGFPMELPESIEDEFFYADPDFWCDSAGAWFGDAEGYTVRFKDGRLAYRYYTEKEQEETGHTYFYQDFYRE